MYIGQDNPMTNTEDTESETEESTPDWQDWRDNANEYEDSRNAYFRNAVNGGAE